jgi:hypothetical protein
MVVRFHKGHQIPHAPPDEIARQSPRTDRDDNQRSDESRSNANDCGAWTLQKSKQSPSSKKEYC